MHSMSRREWRDVWNPCRQPMTEVFIDGAVEVALLTWLAGSLPRA